MLRRSNSAVGVTSTVAALSGARRAVGSAFLAQRVQGDSRSLTPDTLAKRSEQNNMTSQNNMEIMSALSESQTGAQIRFRREDRPWEIVPQYVKRRVVDMVGILNSEHRMEMELVINKVRPICDIDLYVVIVPTVGYVTPRAFAKSIFFDWKIGEPRGNGVLLCIAQGEAEVQLITSPGINEYFGQEFVNLLVKEIMQPLLKEGRASYSMLQATYAVARHAQEVRHYWQSSLVPLPVKNQLRTAQKVVYYGAVDTRNFWGALALVGLTVFIWRQIFKLMCPNCGDWLHKVTDEDMVRKCLTDAQRMEFDNGCTQFHVQKCPKCRHETVEVVLRDMYNDTRCLKCEDCENYTVSKETEIIRLATKKNDGLKRETYKCQFCRVGREIDLPLYRPLDAKPDDEKWYNKLLDRAADPTVTHTPAKLV
jgi:uncharacterized membrane protein YgcG